MHFTKLLLLKQVQILKTKILENMDKNSFLKVIYFDEAFVADFMQIIAGGELKKNHGVHNRS